MTKAILHQEIAKKKSCHYQIRLMLHSHQHFYQPKTCVIANRANWVALGSTGMFRPAIWSTYVIMFKNGLHAHYSTIVIVIRNRKRFRLRKKLV